MTQRSDAGEAQTRSPSVSSQALYHWATALPLNSTEDEFQPLIKTQMQENKDFSCFKNIRCCIYHANKCSYANNCWHFNIYEHDKFESSMKKY